MLDVAIKKDGKLVRIYRVQRFWNAPGKIDIIKVPELTEEDFWPFNQEVHTQQSLGDHIRKINKVRFTKPIILYPDGRVADGFHRILRANTHGIAAINAKTLTFMPTPIKTLTVEEYLKSIKR